MNSPPESSEHRDRRKRGFVRILGGVGLLAVVTLLAYVFWPDGGDAAGERLETTEDVPAGEGVVDVVVVEAVDFPLQVSATGHLRAVRESKVSAGATGVVRERLVQDGSAILRGQVVARLDNTEATLALREAEANLAKAEADYTMRTLRPQADHEEGSLPAAPDDAAQAGEPQDASARLAAARRAHARGQLADEEFRRIEQELSGALSPGDRRRNDIVAAISGVTQAQAAVERARTELARTVIRAPFSGRVTDVQFEVGQYLSTGAELFTLVDVSPIEVDVAVLEEVLDRVRPGARAVVLIPALQPDGGPGSASGARFDGRVDRIDPVVDPTTGMGRVVVQVPNPNGRLMPGVFAEVRIDATVLNDRLVVPADAVLERQGRSLVFVVRGGKANWTYVEVEERSGDYIAISDGLAAGDTVAVAGHAALAEAARVEVRSVGVAYDPAGSGGAEKSELEE